MKARIEAGIVDPADLEAAAEEGEEGEDGVEGEASEAGSKDGGTALEEAGLA
jgi:hypothetical protein